MPTVVEPGADVAHQRREACATLKRESTLDLVLILRVREVTHPERAEDTQQAKFHFFRPPLLGD